MSNVGGHWGGRWTEKRRREEEKRGGRWTERRRMEDEKRVQSGDEDVGQQHTKQDRNASKEEDEEEQRTSGATSTQQDNIKGGFRRQEERDQQMQASDAKDESEVAIVAELRDRQEAAALVLQTARQKLARLLVDYKTCVVIDKAAAGKGAK